MSQVTSEDFAKDAAEIIDNSDALLKLEKQVADLEKENLTLIADMTNLRKRTAEDVKRNNLFANQKLVVSLLSALDTLDSALSIPEDQYTVQLLLEGCKMTQNQLMKILKDAGLEKIETEGMLFNPDEHEAIQTEARDDLHSQSIIQTYQNGYKLNGRVVRTAKVSINSN